LSAIKSANVAHAPKSLSSRNGLAYDNIKGILYVYDPEAKMLLFSKLFSSSTLIGNESQAFVHVENSFNLGVACRGPERKRICDESVPDADFFENSYWYVTSKTNLLRKVTFDISGTALVKNTVDSRSPLVPKIGKTVLKRGRESFNEKMFIEDIAFTLKGDLYISWHNSISSVFVLSMLYKASTAPVEYVNGFRTLYTNDSPFGQIAYNRFRSVDSGLFSYERGTKGKLSWLFCAGQPQKIMDLETTVNPLYYFPMFDDVAIILTCNGATTDNMHFGVGP
jgi:hypothetical protein